MQTLIKPKAKKNALEDNLIPMINIIFLLLIFFMIAGQISQVRNTQAVSIPLSNSEADVQVVPLQIAVTEDQRYFLNDTLTSLAEIEAQLSTSGEESKKTVNLLADKTLKAKALAPVLALLRQYNIKHVALLTSQAGNRAQ